MLTNQKISGEQFDEKKTRQFTYAFSLTMIDASWWNDPCSTLADRSPE